MPLNERSIFGTTALSNAVQNIPDAYAHARFSRATDRRTGYRTRSILSVPVSDHAGEVLGVLQLINKKAEGSDGQDGDAAIVAFNAADEELALNFALALAGSVRALSAQGRTARSLASAQRALSDLGSECTECISSTAIS